MKRKPYPSDLTDEQWKLIAPLLPEAKPSGRPRDVDLREILDEIFYLVKGGIPWRFMPHALPPWGTVHFYYLPPMTARRHLGEDRGAVADALAARGGLLVRRARWQMAKPKPVRTGCLPR